MNTSSTSFTAFHEEALDQSEYFDAQPLHLSGQSSDPLDAFDFMLEEDDDEIDHIGPMALDSFSLTGMDMIQEEEEETTTFVDNVLSSGQGPQHQHRRGQRDRSTSPLRPQDTKKRQRFSSSTRMNFDPPIREISIHGGGSSCRQHNERQTSQGDISMADQSTATCTTSTSCTSSSSLFLFK